MIEAFLWLIDICLLCAIWHLNQGLLDYSKGVSKWMEMQEAMNRELILLAAKGKSDDQPADDNLPNVSEL